MPSAAAELSLFSPAYVYFGAEVRVGAAAQLKHRCEHTTNNFRCVRFAFARQPRDGAKVCWLPSWAFQEPQIERHEYQDNSDVCYEPLPEVVPQEEDVHADHDAYHGEHVKHDGGLSSHCFVLVCAAELGERGTRQLVELLVSSRIRKPAGGIRRGLREIL
jgi:hypothetical protein